MVSNISYFHPYLGKISNLSNIFQMGWNHQPEKYCIRLHTGCSTSLLSCNLNGVPGVSMTRILFLVDQGESSWWFVQAFRRRCAGLWGKVLYEPFMGTPSEGTKMGSIRVRIYESPEANKKDVEAYMQRLMNGNQWAWIECVWCPSLFAQAD